MNGALVVPVGVTLALAAWLLALRRSDGAERVTIAVVLAIFATAFNVIVPIPDVEATTLVVVCLALTLGPAPAVLAGALAVLGSGVTGGIGVWTAWQVVGYAAVALVATAVGATSRTGLTRYLDKLRLLALVVLVTLLYDVLLTVSTVAVLGVGEGQSGSPVLGALLVGLPYTLTHVAGNLVLAAAGSTALMRALERAARRVGTTRA